MAINAECLLTAIMLFIGFAAKMEYSKQPDCNELRVSAPKRRMRPAGSSFNNDFLYTTYRLLNTPTNNELFSESRASERYRAVLYLLDATRI